MIIEHCKHIPSDLSEGVLYVSLEYEMAIHKCCCGCGNEVATPISEGEWTLTEEDGFGTLSPSIGSFQLPCKSHYFIKKNKVEWCKK